MALRKWMLIILYLLGFLSFGYLSYLEFTGEGKFGYLMALCSILVVYQMIRFLYLSKDKKWNSKNIIADTRILNSITLSLAISYLYILLFLLIGIIGFNTNMIVFNPFDLIVAAVITSLLGFMILQIIQRIFK